MYIVLNSDYNHKDYKKMAERILTDNIVSITELKNNPMNAVASAGGNAVAVLNRNKPAFYAVPADLYEEMLEQIDNNQITKIIKSRDNEPSIEVSLDEL